MLYVKFMLMGNLLDKGDMCFLLVLALRDAVPSKPPNLMWKPGKWYKEA